MQDAHGYDEAEKGRRPDRALRRVVGAVVMGALLVTATPIAAQTRSPGYTFLENVRKRAGADVLAQVAEPGSTIINTRDITTGQTALHIVTEDQDLPWLQTLLAKGADPNIADKQGIVPLQIAAQLGWVDGVDMLARSGADVNVTTDTGETPLIAAVHRRDTDMVRTLIKRGANVEKADNSGRSARDYAGLLPAGSVIATVVAEVPSMTSTRRPTYGPN